MLFTMLAHSATAMCTTCTEREVFFTPGGFKLQTHLENYKGVNFRAQFKLMKCNLEFDSLKRGLNIRGETEGWLLVGNLPPCEPNTNSQPRVKGRQLTAAL
jgi:hypothetical protein